MQQLAPEGMAELLGVTGEDIDHRYPIQEVSTGLPFIIVPLKTLTAVKKCRPDTQKLLRYEDPATGSANECLAAYLLKYRYQAPPFWSLASNRATR